MQVVFIYKLYIRGIHAQYHFLALSMNTPFPATKIAYIYENNRSCFISSLSFQILTCTDLKISPLIQRLGGSDSS